MKPGVGIGEGACSPVNSNCESERLTEVARGRRRDDGCGRVKVNSVSDATAADSESVRISHRQNNLVGPGCHGSTGDACGVCGFTARGKPVVDKRDASTASRCR